MPHLNNHTRTTDAGTSMQVTDNEFTRYQTYIKRKIILGFGVAIISAILACVTTWQLISFLISGSNMFGPAITFLILVASTGLTTVAVVSIRTGRKYSKQNRLRIANMTSSHQEHDPS